MAKFRPKHNGHAPDSPLLNGGRSKQSPGEVEARKMILTGLIGKKNATVRMDSLKPNVAYVARVDIWRDLAALPDLSPELGNK